MRRMLNAVLCSALLLSTASYAAAQVERASLTGTVKDQSDAVVPGATVTARNTSTDVPSSTTSDTQRAAFIGDAHVRDVAEGEKVVSKGDQATVAYFILEGEAAA